MKQSKVFVPGKIILAGEHSVVYGKLALAVSLDLGVEVSVTNTEEFMDNLIKNDEKGLVKKAIEIAGGDDSLVVQIQSSLPIGSGLGSSAAVSAAVIKGVREVLNNPVNDNELFDLTFECEKLAHGNASGIDPAAVVYRGLIAYKKGEPFERFLIKEPIKLLLINSGKPKESTKQMVELVALNPNNISISDKIESLVIRTREKLINGEDVAELLNENGILLEELGVVGSVARDISSALREIGCSVKITGAGGVKSGSGMMIAICSDYSNAKKLLDNMHVAYFETIIGEK